MPQAKYTGNPMGSGNPPGKYSSGYLSMPDGAGESHFILNPTYKGDMHVPVDRGAAPSVGNQPKDKSEGSVNWSGKPALR